MKVTSLTLGNHIRTLRFHHGELSQKALAELVGVTRQTINAIEQNKYSPTLELAFKIAVAFEVPITEVFFCELPKNTDE